MTTPHQPLTDEDLSSALDGEATDDVVTRIAQDPDARARQEELAAAAAFIATGPLLALPAGAVDSMIDQALDVPLAPPAPARRSGPPGWLVAAVVVLLVGVGLTLVWNGRAGDSKFNTVGNRIDVASGAGSAADSAETKASGHGGSTATTVAAPTAAASDLANLGAFETGDALRTAISKQPAPWAAPAETGAGTGSQGADVARSVPDAAIQRCAEQLKVTLGLEGDPKQQALALVDGKTVLLYAWDHASFKDGSPSTLIAAVGVDACDQVVVFER